MTSWVNNRVRSVIGCETCGHISCVCHVIDAHPDPECGYRISVTCSVPIECPHGFDVCPECDPCTCTGE